jgi:hypothetical protein
MPAYRRVDAQRAGTAALGILVPHGARTVVILRPRGLEWDLLPAHWTGAACAAPVFCQFEREEAALIARRVAQALEETARAARDPVETFGNPLGQEFQVWVRAGEYVWIVCRRVPGQAYAPVVFASSEEAENAGRCLAPFFHPGPEAAQEYYFNTQNFTH